MQQLPDQTVPCTTHGTVLLVAAAVAARAAVLRLESRKRRKRCKGAGRHDLGGADVVWSVDARRLGVGVERGDHAVKEGGAAAAAWVWRAAAIVNGGAGAGGEHGAGWGGEWRGG